ncbi:hypothetical protein [Mucilaginibacter sp. 44-25]|uniref:hypothetical protein n=1 Tax=Mucilaginibacter sp. 44-25 TaxID=1895794 RepID=UPI0009610C7C|nr:hypothetical protein [Mucilaginibacter sp. 44-25]OJW12837.1 MAG: hypothetical protein BGO48_02860 [Mucilaginibacter sp. 44-25]HEK21576.1 hypothetical protein [Bacteroidota bacterium]
MFVGLFTAHPVGYRPKHFSPAICCTGMTTPANNHHKPSPSDTPTKRPNDEGHESIVRKEDEQYNADEPQQENVADYTENREQPVQPVKNPPAEHQPDATDDDERRLESK